MPTDFAAFSALRKSLQAIITCHSPDSPIAFAVASPKPEEAPVIITLPFLRVFFCLEVDWVIAGVVAAVCALIGFK
ncbi:hypothetical protein K7X08_011580 [Anisodus acutangulus]|uniref:Uncharacterized protein n=1 Tax=Anisodus acutangulus TaxID=402998 RepID=A0A9Q1MNQ7_9SOLA|nr:hypothetical protein K7X08_011580 [Anisodus acutangulus]